MGLVGGSSGSSGSGPTRYYKGRAVRGYTGSSPDRIVVGNMDEISSTHGGGPSPFAPGEFMSYGKFPSQGAIYMERDKFEEATRTLEDVMSVDGWEGVKGLLTKDPDTYYDIFKQGVINRQELNKAPWEPMWKKLYDEKPDLFKKDKYVEASGNLLASFDQARKMSYPKDPETGTPTGPAPGTGGTGGEVGDGSLLTSEQREKKRVQGLNATNGALTLGSVSLLGS